jgi:chromosome segregation ATPase
MNSKAPLDRVYGEMIYSLLTEMNGALMSQVRSINNNEANILRAMSDLQKAIDNLNISLRDTRDKRYQEEIDAMELQMTNLQKLLDEKKTAVQQIGPTSSQKMRSLATEVATTIIQAEQKRKSIDWLDVRNKVLPYVLGAVILAITLYLIPQIGHLLQVIFTPK